MPHPPATASTVPLHASLLREGRMVPLFYLPAAGGGQSGPAALRSKYNMALAFVEGGPEGEAYLMALAGAYREIQDRQAKVLAVIALPLASVEEMAARLKLPYTLLADKGGATTRRMLGEGKCAALCVADRFGQVFYVATAPSAAALPPVQATLDWLDYIELQCPE